MITSCVRKPGLCFLAIGRTIVVSGNKCGSNVVRGGMEVCDHEDVGGRSVRKCYLGWNGGV